MPGFVSNWQEQRRNRRKGGKAKKGVVFTNAKKAGINMGRDELRTGVDRILAKWWPNQMSVDGGSYIQLHTTHSLEELDEAKEAVMLEEPPDFVIVLGGDGTTQKTLGEDKKFLEYLFSDRERAPEVIVLGAGSKNVVPTALKLLGDDPLQAFDVVCEKYVRDIPRDIVCCPILKINDRHGFIYGSGVVVNALDEYYRHKAGPSRALKTGLGVVWRETLGRLNPWRRASVFRRFEAEAHWRDANGADQKAALDRYNTFVASSIREINPWLKITHRTGERLGCFHGLGLNNGFWRSALNLPAMVVGAPMLGEVQDMVTDRMVIRYAEDMKHTIDGEIYKTTADLGRSVEGDHSVVIQTGPFIEFVVG